MTPKRLTLALLATLLAAALVPAALARTAADPSRTAEASSCSSPTLSGPTQAQVGQSYTITGCGFAPGRLVPLELMEAGCCSAISRFADADGNLSFTRSVSGAGQFRTRASAQRNGKGRWRVVASWSFQASG